MKLHRKIFHRRLLSMLAAVFFFGLLAYFNLFGVFGPIRQGIWYVLKPFVHSAYVMTFEVRDFFHFIGSIGGLKSENDRLYNENIRLQARIASMQDVEQENAYLRDMVKVLPKDKYELETASVAGGSPNGAGDWLMIDKGTANGISDGMPVIAYDGVLIGRVENAQYSTARVRLLSSQESVVNVQTIASNAKGVVRGRFGLGLTLQMVLQTDVLTEGDRLVTSDVGSEYPSGFFVGEISSIEPSPNSLFQQAAVVSPISFSDLRFVSIVKKIL